MPVKRKITGSSGVYFITFTCFQWKPLIELTNGYDLVYSWFDHLKNKGHFITGFVIMPNHVHAMIAFRNTGQSINTIVGNGKRFIAYGIIKRLIEQNENQLLQQLSISVKKTDKKRNKLHEVWEDSFDWKECKTNEFMNQKLAYMHENPNRGKWNLVCSLTEYRHSSANYYINHTQGFYPVTNFAILADIDLTTPL